MIRPPAPTVVRMALARTASAGGKSRLNATTSGTHAAAASPVIARPTRTPCAASAVPIIHAPSPTSTRPTRMNGFRRPTQSTAMPSGSRTSICHSPYMDRMVPTRTRLEVLV